MDSASETAGLWRSMDDAEETVLLVDAEDREIGRAPKLDAHRQGLRHRALSVVIRNAAGEMLLQRRAAAKYHSGGLWTNACCSHPRAGEPVERAAARRLAEEMGLICPLEPLFVGAYDADVGGGLIENEVVHVFGGWHEGAPAPNPEEAEGFAWIALDALEADMAGRPERYTVWFRHYLARHRAPIAAFLAR